jgi:Skp family chaperone for outer membrane proteins
MRGFVLSASLAVVLSAAPAFAQAGQAKPAQTPPAAAKPAQTPPPATPPAQAAPAPAPQPPAPFPAGAKIGVVNLQLIAQNSVEGKAATARVQALIQKKQVEGQDKAKQLQANQQKLQTSGGVMNEAARTALERDIERQTKEGERFQQDAQAEVNELQQELQNEFQKKLFPLLQQLAQEKGLQALLSLQDAGVIWWEPGIDLTPDAVKKLDAASPAKPTGTPKQ